MIVGRDINPKRDFYYLGAKTIEVLSSFDDDEVDSFNVFKVVKETEDISINLFILTLDWLFIVGAIDKSQKGFIKKCF